MAKVTHHVGGKFVSENSQVTSTSNNPFEKAKSKTEYDTCDPVNHLPGSENIIVEFNKKWQEDYKIKTAAELQSVFWTPS